MSEISHLFKRAKKAATRAIEAERNGDLSQAFDQFLLAADILNQMMAIERTKSIRDKYYAKAREYISRAKELKMVMDARGKAISPGADEGLPDLPGADLPSPPSSTDVAPRKAPPPPPPKDDDRPMPSDRPSKPRPVTPPPPPDPSSSPEDLTPKMMRGEGDVPPPAAGRSESPKPVPRPSPPTPKPPPSDNRKREPPKPAPSKKEIPLPTKTTFEILLDAGKYTACIIECTESVEAELRVRMGLFDEQLTLGMLINRGLEKGMTTLKEFKFVNILRNRIEHEHYRPSRSEAERAVAITNKILMS